MDNVEILSFFYSNWFSDMLINACFPSLFLNTNVPELMKNRKVIHNIYCSKNENEYLKKNYIPLANNCGLEVFINDSIIVGNFADYRNLLHLAIKDQIKKSIKNKSVIIVSPPDMIFGHGLANVINNMEYGEYVVCGQARISIEDGFEKLQNFLKSNPLSNKEFVKFFVEGIPHFIVREAKRKRYDYEYIEKSENGWVAYMKEPPPLVFYGSDEILKEGFKSPYFGQFEAIDHDIPNMFFKKGKLRWIDNSETFFWGELTSNDKYTKMFVNDYWSEAAKFFTKQPINWKTK